MSDEIKKGFEELKTNFADVLLAQKERTKAEDTKHANLVDKIEKQNKAADDMIAKMSALEEKASKLEEANEKAKAKQKEIEIAFARKFDNAVNEKFDLKSCETTVRSFKDNNVPADFKYTKEQYDLHKKAFDIWFKHGNKGLYNSGQSWSIEEQKFINTIVGPQGGFLVAPQYSSDIMPKKFNGRGILQLVDRMVIGGTAYVEPVDASDYADAAWSNELADAPSDASNEDFQELTYYPHAIIYPKKISRTALEDSYVDIGYFNNKMQEGSMRTIATSLLTGTAQDKPRGILTYASGTAVTGQVEQIEGGTSLEVTWTDLIEKLPAALKTGYQVNSSYLMNNATWRHLLVQRDTAGRYEMSEILSILGKAPNNNEGISTGVNIVLDAGMPDYDTAGKLPIVYGDFKAGYLMVERVGFSLIRDETNPKFITFYVRRRVGGQVRISEALKILVTKS